MDDRLNPGLMKQELKKHIEEMLSRKHDPQWAGSADYLEGSPWYIMHAEVLKDIDQDFIPPYAYCHDVLECMSWHPSAHRPIEYGRYVRDEVLRANKGDLYAIRRLGNFYSICGGVCMTEVERYRRDIEAMKWHRVAALAGCSESARRLMDMHFDSCGWENDYEWHKWKAIADGERDWCYDEFYQCVKPTLDRSDYAAAESGRPERQYRLGDAYFFGMSNVSISRQEAVYWYAKAATEGYKMACIALGDCYYWGYGTHQNHNLAEAWYLRAADVASRSSRWPYKEMLKRCKVADKKIRNRQKERLDKWLDNDGTWRSKE